MSPLQDIACHPLRGRDFDANLVCARDIMLVMPANRGTWPPPFRIRFPYVIKIV